MSGDKCDHVVNIGQCEFCDEFVSSTTSRFGQLYSRRFESRVLLREDGFVVLPPMGQLFKGSLLILPEKHFETMASMSKSTRSKLTSLIARLQTAVKSYGRPFVFEHGAKSQTGSGCGVYHAHMHVVPLPDTLSYSMLLPGTLKVCLDIETALTQLEFSSLYLLIHDTEGQVAFAEPSAGDLDVFSSQYIRRRLVDVFNLRASWNWRDYNSVEPWLVETVNTFKRNVSFSR